MQYRPAPVSGSDGIFGVVKSIRLSRAARIPVGVQLRIVLAVPIVVVFVSGLFSRRLAS